MIGLRSAGRASLSCTVIARPKLQMARQSFVDLTSNPKSTSIVLAQHSFPTPTHP